MGDVVGFLVCDREGRILEASGASRADKMEEWIAAGAATVHIVRHGDALSALPITFADVWAGRTLDHVRAREEAKTGSVYGRGLSIT